MLSATLRAPPPIFSSLGNLPNLVSGETVPFADRSNAEMAPKKGRKKATGPTKTPRTIARSAEFETKLNRLGELKVKFAGVAKALKPALAELAARTTRQLDRPADHQDGHHKAQYDALVAELEDVRDSNIGLRIACRETQQELKAVSVQHETLQEMMTIENRYRVTDPCWTMTADIH